MKYTFALVVLLLSQLFAYTQDFTYYTTRDGVDVACKWGEKAVTFQFKNRNNQKVYVSTGDVLWFRGELMAGKSNSSGLTLAPNETSSFGMFFYYPEGYDKKNYQSLRFKLSYLKVEIGGMGNDPRYQKTQTKSQSSEVKGGQGLPEIDFDKGATREPGSNEWKPMHPLNEIKFPGEDQSNTQKPNTTQTNNSKPSNNKSPNPNIKLNGLYYSNGTASNNTTTKTGTETANEKQQYQKQADSYLNEAQKPDQSSITRNLNLELAKVNAKLAGNTQQLELIEKLQNNEGVEIDGLGQSTTNSKNEKASALTNTYNEDLKKSILSLYQLTNSPGRNPYYDIAAEYQALSIASYSKQDKNTYGLLSLGSLVAADIQKIKQEKEEEKRKKLEADLQRYHHSLNKLAETNELITKSVRSIDSLNMDLLLEQINLNCYHSLIVYFRGKERGLFDKNTLSEEVSSFMYLFDLEKILNKQKRNPEDENIFGAAEAYTVGTSTFRVQGKNREGQIKASFEKATDIINKYLHSKSNKNNIIKQLKGKLANLIIEESFFPNDEKHFSERAIRYDSLKLEAKEAKTKNPYTFDPQTGLLIGDILYNIQVKVIRCNYELYLKTSDKQSVAKKIIEQYEELLTMTKAITSN